MFTKWGKLFQGMKKLFKYLILIIKEEFKGIKCVTAVGLQECS